jgi:hypothetical protein
MSKDRREFVKGAASALLGGLTLGGERAGSAAGSDPAAPPTPATWLNPNAGTARADASITANTFAEAGRLARIEMSERERLQAAQTWHTNMGGLAELRTGPRKLGLGEADAPFSQIRPLLLRASTHGAGGQFVRDARDPGRVPTRENDIEFAPVWKLSRWIESR